MNFSTRLSNKFRYTLSVIYRKLNFANSILNSQRAKVQKVIHNGITYNFAIPNILCVYRADTFSSKEPETLDWIDTIEPGSIFWDIGANVGLYSVYAAKKGCKVYAFEPSVFNLEVLARNANLNDVTNLISIIPGALSDKTGFGTLNMTSTQIGGALSTFDKLYGFDGKALKTIFSYTTFALTIDDAVHKFGIPAPEHIKLDVDGIEHLILSGSSNSLYKVKTVLIEISQEFKEQKTILTEFLIKEGFHHKKFTKEELNKFNISEDMPTVNQIWVRN
jgi:FkbM family methyltransferase